jgi:hypothetical protein
MIRKMGGFSFQELNLAMDDIKAMARTAPTSPTTSSPAPPTTTRSSTGDTEFLRLTLRLALELGIDPASLVHALQNHDELTHELVHFSTGTATTVHATRRGDHAARTRRARAADLRPRLTGPARRTTARSPRTASPARPRP